MTDARQRDDTNNIQPESLETFVSVKNLLKEFGEKVIMDTNDDDDTFVSVKDRLRKFDSRQDDGGDFDNDDDTYTKAVERCKEDNQSRVQVLSVGDYSTSSIVPPGKSSCASFGPIASSPSTPRSVFAHRKTPISMKSSIPMGSSELKLANPKSFPPLTVSLVLGETNCDGSSSSMKGISSKEMFQYGNVLLKKVEKPVEDKWKRNILGETSSEIAETQRKVQHLLKKVEKPIEDRWKRIVNVESEGTQRKFEDISGRLSLSSIIPPTNDRLKDTSLPRTKSELKKEKYTLRNVIDDQDISKSLHKRHFQKSSPPTSNYKPESLNFRSTSLPTFSGVSPEQTSFVREEKYRNDFAAALKKVELPIEDKWKSMKNSDENISETSKPVFATLKLRSVGTPSNNSTIQTLASTRFNETLQYFDDQRSPNSLKQKYNFENDKKSDVAKRRRMPTSAEAVHTSVIYFKESGRERNIANCTSHKIASEGISVSDLAKTFSTQINLTSKDECTEEEKVTGRMTSRQDEIAKMRYTLTSSAKEIEELRKTLISSTPVSKLIAERNKAAQANRFQNNFATKKSHRRTKSLTSSSRRNSHCRTNSISSTHTENYETDGRSSVRALHSPSWKRNRDGDVVIGQPGNTPEGDCPDDFSVRWEDFNANNIIIESGDIWDLNLDDSAFFNGHSNCSCPALKYYDDDISGSHHDDSTLSDCTSSSDGDFCYENHGHSRYIQISLSSGDIAEKFEPTIVMSPTESSSTFDGASIENPSGYPTEESTDASAAFVADSKRDKLKGLVPLKGAKKFFFGKNKKKSSPIEV